MFTIMLLLSLGHFDAIVAVCLLLYYYYIIVRQLWDKYIVKKKDVGWQSLNLRKHLTEYLARWSLGVDEWLCQWFNQYEDATTVLRVNGCDI